MNHNSARKSLIAVIGDAWLAKDDPHTTVSRNMGQALVDAGYRIVTGGLGGVMEAASAGAHESANYNSGDVIGILPGTDPTEANPYVDISIATGLALSRNLIIANSDAVIAIGGGPGTLSEMALSWQMKRLVIAFNCEGWSGKLADEPLDLRRNRYPELLDDRVHGVKTVHEAIEKLDKYLPHYSKRLAQL